MELEMEVELDLALAPHEAPPVQVEGVAPHQAGHPRVPTPHLGAPLTGFGCGQSMSLCFVLGTLNVGEVHTLVRRRLSWPQFLLITRVMFSVTWRGSLNTEHS